jgi:hypothetical protein
MVCLQVHHQSSWYGSCSAWLRITVARSVICFTWAPKPIENDMHPGPAHGPPEIDISITASPSTSHVLCVCRLHSGPNHSQKKTVQHREPSFRHGVLDIMNLTHARWFWNRNQDGISTHADAHYIERLLDGCCSLQPHATAAIACMPLASVSTCCTAAEVHFQHTCTAQCLDYEHRCETETPATHRCPNKRQQPPPLSPGAASVGAGRAKYYPAPAEAPAESPAKAPAKAISTAPAPAKEPR